MTSSFDLSTASAYEIRYVKPNGTSGSWTATLNSTTNIQYTTTSADDLDASGKWTFQGYASYPAGSTVYTKRVTDEIGAVIS